MRILGHLRPIRKPAVTLRRSVIEVSYSSFLLRHFRLRLRKRSSRKLNAGVSGSHCSRASFSIPIEKEALGSFLRQRRKCLSDHNKTRFRVMGDAGISVGLRKKEASQKPLPVETVTSTPSTAIPIRPVPASPPTCLMRSSFDEGREITAAGPVTREKPYGEIMVGANDHRRGGRRGGSCPEGRPADRSRRV